MPFQPPIAREEQPHSLLAKVRRNGLGWLRALLTKLILLGIPAAILAWLAWPLPPLPNLEIVAFDGVANPEAVLDAWMIPRNPAAPASYPEDLKVKFEIQTVPPAAPLPPIEARTDSTGHTKATLASVEKGIYVYKVIYVLNMRIGQFEGQARLFSWTNNVPLFLVDVNAVGNAPYGWVPWRRGPTRPNQAHLQQNADKALKRVQAKGYHVVYLAAGAKTFNDYQEMRAWIGFNSFLLPEGPMLGLPAFGDKASPAKDWTGLIERAIAHRPGCVAVVRDPQFASVLHKLGVRTFVYTPMPRDARPNVVPAGTVLLDDWSTFDLGALK